MSSILTRRGSRAPTRSRSVISAEVERHRLAGELPLGDQPVERALEVAAVGDHRLGDVFEDGSGMSRPGLCALAPRVAGARGSRRRSSRSGAPISKATPPFEPRADALVERLQLGRRPVGGNHHLPRAVDRAFSMWQNSCCTDLPCRNCMSSMSRRSISRRLSLNAIADWLRSAATKRNMKCSAVR